MKKRVFDPLTVVEVAEKFFRIALTILAVLVIILAAMSLAGCGEEEKGSLLSPDGLAVPVVGVEVVQIDTVMDDSGGTISKTDKKGWRLFLDTPFQHDDLAVAVSVVKYKHGREVEDRVTYAIVPKREKRSPAYSFKNSEVWGDEFRIRVLETPSANLPVGKVESEGGVPIPAAYPWYQYDIHGIARYEQ